MIVAVAGGKGGVGKSTIALNLARELDAVVVDGDVATADLPRGRGPDLHDVLAGRASPLEAVEQIGQVRVLPCGRSLAGARASDLTAITEVVDAVDKQFGRVVLDSPAGLASDVGLLLYAADLAALVTTPDESARLDAARTRQLALEVETPIGGVALNRVAEETADRADVVERDLGAPVTVVPESDALSDAQEAGTPIRDANPEAVAADRIASLAATIEQCDRRSNTRSGVR